MLVVKLSRKLLRYYNLEVISRISFHELFESSQRIRNDSFVSVGAMASFTPAFHTGLSPPATASQGTGGSVADETASSGIREPPLVRTRLGDSRAHGVRPAVPARSNVVGAGQPAANSQGVQAAPVVSQRTHEGVGAGQPAADAYPIRSSNDSDVASVASSAQLELARAREELALARLERLEAEMSSSKRSSRSKSSRG